MIRYLPLLAALVLGGRGLGMFSDIAKMKLDRSVLVAELEGAGHPVGNKHVIQCPFH